MTYHLIYSSEPYRTFKQKFLDDYYYFLSVSTKTNMSFGFLSSETESQFAYGINFGISYLDCYLYQIIARISEFPDDHRVVWIKLIDKPKSHMVMSIHQNSILHKLPVNSVHSSGDNLEEMFNNFILFMKILEVHST